MKKLLIAILGIAAVLGLTLFGGCGQGTGEPFGSEATVTVVLDNKEDAPSVFLVPVGKAGLTSAAAGIDVLDVLAEGGTFYYQARQGAYGAYLLEMGTVRTDESGEYPVTVYDPVLQEGNGNYIYVYTSVEKDQDTGNYASEVEYLGQTLVNSAVGVSYMSVEAGAVLYYTYY